MTTSTASNSLITSADFQANHTPVPPLPLDDERAVVGAAVNATPDLRTLMLATFKNSDLIDPQCRFVDALMRQMDAQQIPIDPISIPSFARRTGATRDGAPRMSLALFVADLSRDAPPALSGEWHASVIVESAARRQVRAAGLELTRVADNGSLDQLAAAVAEQCAAAVAAIARAEVAAA